MDDPTSDDDGQKDDIIDLPPDDAPFVQGLVLHRARARCNPNEEEMVYNVGSSEILRAARHENP